MASPADSPIYATLRQRMVDEHLRARGITDERVLEAMARVPRHEFAPPRFRDQAYEDHPLPIGEGQTISQPYIVAIMLEALSLMPTDRMLEVGTGSGYVTALLAQLTAEVISIERHRALADSAREVLSRLGYRNVRVIGWRWQPGIRRSRTLQCDHRFGCRPAVTARIDGGTGGRWKTYHPDRVGGFAATAVD